MKPTAIQWTDLSTNPVVFHDGAGKKHWHCEKVSAGCTNCYAETLEKRFGGDGAGYIAKNTPDRHASLDEAELRRILRYRVKDGKNRVFPFDMTDVFAPWVTDEMLDRLFAVFALRPDLVFQVLTKRPARMREYIERVARLGWAHIDVGQRFRGGVSLGYSLHPGALNPLLPWPLPNVWLGTSVEDQPAADTRIPHLLATPAAVRFLSCEPLLGPVTFDLSWWGRCFHLGFAGRDAEANHLNCACHLDWVIIGGESGVGARPMDLAWVRSLLAQCRAAGVAPFVKQLGAKPYNGHDQLAYDTVLSPRLKLRDRHGGNWDEWPADLRVREFPNEQRGTQNGRLEQESLPFAELGTRNPEPAEQASLEAGGAG